MIPLLYISLPILVCIIGLVVMMERARSGKDEKKDECVAIEFMPALINREIYKPLSEWIGSSTSHKILAVFREEEFCGKGRVGIFVGVTDALSNSLAVLDGPDAFFGHPILALECDFRSTNPEIIGIFDDLRKQSQKQQFPKRINYYQVTDKSIEVLLADSMKWIEGIDQNILGENVG